MNPKKFPENIARNSVKGTMTKYPNRQSKTTAKTMAQNKNTSFVSGYNLLNGPFFRSNI
jgi:hypothetical protein